MAALRATLALLAAHHAIADYTVTKTYSGTSCSGTEQTWLITDVSPYGGCAVAASYLFTCKLAQGSTTMSQSATCVAGAFTAPTGSAVQQIYTTQAGTTGSTCAGSPTALLYFPSSGCISSGSDTSVKYSCSAGIATQTTYTSSTCSGNVYASYEKSTGCVVGSSDVSKTFCTSETNTATIGGSGSSTGPATIQASVTLSNVDMDVLSASRVNTFAAAINSQLSSIPGATIKVVGIFDASNTQLFYYYRRRELATTTATLVVAVTSTLASSAVATGLPTYIQTAVNTAYPTGGMTAGSATIVCTSSCSSTSVSSGYYSGSGSLVFGTDDTDANNLTSSGVAASVVIAGVLAAAVLVCVLNGPKGDADPAAAEYKGRAASAWSIIYAGVVFQVFGILAGLAAPAIPWIYGSATASYGGTSGGGYYIFTAVAYTLKACYNGSCVSSTYPLGLYAVGAAINYVGMFFLAISFIVASCAARRVRGVAVAGILPPRTTCCCAASLPAINGLSWCGLLIQIAGAIFMWTIFGIVVIALGIPLQVGSRYLAASVAFNIIAAILFSVANCCSAGSIPYVGRSPTVRRRARPMNDCETCTFFNPNYPPPTRTELLLRQHPRGEGRDGHGAHDACHQRARRRRSDGRRRGPRVGAAPRATTPAHSILHSKRGSHEPPIQ